MRTGGDVEARVRGQYVVGREGERVDLLDVMATYDYRLDWMLASEANIETEFNRRSETNGTPEYRIAQEHMRPPPAEEQLSRNALQGMIQQNARGILERLYVAAGMESTQSARENYRVVFDRNLELQDPDERSNVYYIRLVDPTTESGSQGSIIIGNDDDRRHDQDDLAYA